MLGIEWGLFPMLLSMLGIEWELFPMLLSMLGIEWELFPLLFLCWECNLNNFFYSDTNIGNGMTILFPINWSILKIEWGLFPILLSMFGIEWISNTTKDIFYIY